MSKFVFWVWALDASKPLPIFRCEDLPELHEHASIGRLWLRRQSRSSTNRKVGGRSWTPPNCMLKCPWTAQMPPDVLIGCRNVCERVSLGHVDSAFIVSFQGLDTTGCHCLTHYLACEIFLFLFIWAEPWWCHARCSGSGMGFESIF